MLDITMARCSERGQRSVNEDSLRVGQIGSRRYAVLSDGAGGHERGAEASRRVVERVEAALCSTAVSFAPATLTNALLAVHDDLQREQLGAQGRVRMHATVVVLWIDSQHDRAVWSHIGDSRLYRIRYGAVDHLTVDDSVVQRMLEEGVLTAQQALDHPLKSQLLAAVGMQESIEPHTPDTAQPLEDGDAFLLCSDGWWGLFTDSDLIRTLYDADTPQAWLDAMHALIDLRCDPRQDNFSAIAIWVRDPNESTQSMAYDESGVSAPFT